MKICQQTADADQLICHAEQARSSVLKLARALAINLHLDPELNVQMGPIKTRERISEKAMGRKEGRVDLVTDICRERLEVESAKDIIELRKLFSNTDFHEEWHNKAIDIIEFEDYFATPNERGFRALNILLNVDLGKGRFHICELQVVHKGMVAAMDETHAIYSIARKYKEDAKTENRELTKDEIDTINQLEQAARMHHDTAAQRLGLDVLEIRKTPHLKLIA